MEIPALLCTTACETLHTVFRQDNGEYELASMYDKPVRILMQEMIPAMGIGKGDVFSREQAVQWFSEHYPKIKVGTVAAHLIRLSTNAQSRVQYSVKADMITHMPQPSF